MRVLNGKDPVVVSPLLLQILTRSIEEAGVSRDKLAQAATELSRLFTKGRTVLPSRYLQPRHRFAPAIWPISFP